jgi:benzodiazapine receptor
LVGARMRASVMLIVKHRFHRYCRTMSSRKLMSLILLNIVLFIVTVAVNSLAGGSTLINGKTTGAVSDSNPTMITPAGFTFAIWSIIYILLAAFVVYQALPKNRDKPFHEQISFLFILASVLNISWIFLWQYGLFPYSVIFIFGLLMSLAAIYLRLGVGKTDVSLGERICVQLPFSVYLGWITVASIANVAVALAAANWDGFGIDLATWAVLVIAVVLVITLLVISTRKDIAYGLVIIWALFGIMARQLGNWTLVWATTISIAVTVVALIALLAYWAIKKR